MKNEVHVMMRNKFYVVEACTSNACDLLPLQCSKLKSRTLLLRNFYSKANLVLLSCPNSLQ